MRLRVKNNILIFLLLSLLFQACQKDNNPSWDTNVHAPLANGSITITDLLDDSIVNTNNQGIWLKFSRNIYELKADSLVSIPEKFGRISYATPINLIITPGKKLLNTSVDKTIQADPAELNSAHIREGTISLKTKATYDEPVKYTYSFPGITKNGQSLTITETFPAADSGTMIQSNKYNIQNYNIDLTGQNNNAYNKISYQVTARTLDNADTLEITPQDSLALIMKFKDLQLHKFEGYFGQRDFSTTDTTEIDFLSHIESGIIDLDSVNAELQVENGIGADMLMYVNELISINRNNNQTVGLTGNFINSDISIARAVKNTSINPVMKTIDLTNSNIEEFIENLPGEVGYDLNLQLNPLGNISMGNDFFNSDYPLKINLDMNIPLKIAMDNIWLTDTIELQLNKDVPLQNADLKLIIDNYFPVNAEVIVKSFSKFTENKTITNHNNIITSGILNTQNIVDQPTESSVDLNLTEEAIRDLKNTGKLLVQLKLKTNNYEILKFHEHYKIDYKLRGKSTIRINAN